MIRLHFDILANTNTELDNMFQYKFDLHRRQFLLRAGKDLFAGLEK